MILKNFFVEVKGGDIIKKFFAVAAVILGVVVSQFVDPSPAQAYRNGDVADELHYRCYHCGAEYTKVYIAGERADSGNFNEFDSNHNWKLVAVTHYIYQNGQWIRQWHKPTGN